MDYKYFVLLIILIIILIIIYKSSKTEHFATNTKKNKKKTIEAKLAGKVIIITGSTRGIGYELARTLSKLDCRVVIHGRNQKKINDIVEEFRKYNPYTIGYAADLSDEKNVIKFYENVTKDYPKIDILVNNAISLNGDRQISEKKFKDWKKDITVNIDSMFLLTQKVIGNMRRNSTKGRIVNISSYASKLRDSNFHSGTLILSKSLIEKFSTILADENHKYNIAVTTIRIDENILSGSFANIEKIPIYGKRIQDKIDKVTDLIASKPKKLMPMFLYVMKAPYHEIAGKTISSQAFTVNPKLSKIVPSYQLVLKDRVLDKVVLTKKKMKNNKDLIYVNKQNPYGMSPKVEKVIKNTDLKNKTQNLIAEFDGTLDKVIANRIGVKRQQITFFKNEFDAVKKILEIFVPKYCNVIAVFPTITNLHILCKEKKIDLKYAIFDTGRKDKTLQPDYSVINTFTDQHTKLVYFSSPSVVSGHSLDIELFEKFLDQYPDNIPILIDQSFFEFSLKKNQFNPLKYIDRNIIVLRSFNNFYGFENLELTYLITDMEMANFINKTQVLNNNINTYVEEIALAAYKDTKHNKLIREKVDKEKKRIYKKLDKYEIKYLPSETNYILVDSGKPRFDVMKDLEKEKIILYMSDDSYDPYWTLPISSRFINDKILNVLVSGME